MSYRLQRKFLNETMSVAVALSQAFLRIPDAQRAIPTRLGVTPQTSTNYLEGRTMPSAENLIRAMAEFDEVFNEVMRLAGKRVLSANQIEGLKRALNDL